MTDNEQTLDKRLVICPLSFALGYIQNYRVTERPNKGCLESRPVKSADAFADDFFKVLHAPKGEPVEVQHSSGKTITLRGLGQGPTEDDKKGAQALKFPMKAGLSARERAVQAVNTGQIRAPKKNWDSTYGPELVHVYTDPKTGEETTYRLGGGKELDELKAEFPQMYGAKTRTAKTDTADVIDDDALEALESSDEIATEAAISDPIPEKSDELEELADEMEGSEGAFSEDEPAYAAMPTAEAPPSADDLEAMMEEPTQESTDVAGDGDDKISALVIRAPQGSTAVRTAAIKFTDEDGDEIIAYKVKCANGHVTWAQEGHNHCFQCGSEMEITVQ